MRTLKYGCVLNKVSRPSLSERAPWCFLSLPKEMVDHPLIGNTTKLCSALISAASISSQTSPLYPILGNPLFPPGVGGVEFRGLLRAGCMQASNYVTTRKWPTVSDLADQVGAFRLRFWSALQMAHFFRALPTPELFARPLTTFEEYCSETGVMHHTLSACYELLITPTENFPRHF